MKAIATIVTYNPDISLLSSCIAAVVKQVSNVLLYDNASDNCFNVEELCKKNEKILFFRNSENLGLPANYNRASKKASEMGADWLLILDQDTIIPDGYIENIQHYTNSENVAIISPVIWDINIYNKKELMSIIPDEEITLIKDCMSSASLNRLSVLFELGGFDENLFIDWVDLEFCVNVLKHGYDIIRVNSMIVKHQYGKGIRKRFLWKKPIVRNHSAIRRYYMFRNWIYTLRKYNIPIKDDNGYYKEMLKTFVLICLEEDRFSKYKMAFKGCLDGLKMKVDSNLQKDYLNEDYRK